MKILHVNTVDIAGGAARAASRLHLALLNEGIQSQMLVQLKSSEHSSILAPTSKVEKLVNQIRSALDQKRISKYSGVSSPFSPCITPFSNLLKRINEERPDIVHLHWVQSAFLNIRDLQKISTPIVWSLHDMWPFTGGCHYSGSCSRYTSQCGKCDVLRSNNDNDLSRKIFLIKKRALSDKPNINIVAVSEWLADEARKSTLFRRTNIHTISNGLDTNRFDIFDKSSSRKLFNLPLNKRLVMFGAINATKDPRKGYKELLEALQYLATADTEIVIFGASRPKNLPKFQFNSHYVGHLSDDQSLAALYSAVDVMVVPSTQEAFGQTASEAMACGTPVVAFGATGLLDIVEHKVNGYLAKPFDTNALAKGIDWVIRAKNYPELCQKARFKAVSEFDTKIVAQKYIDLYAGILV